MAEQMGQHIAQIITKAIKAGKVISFGVDIADNQYKEIRWSQYGLIDTNEIAVMVTCGGKSFAASAPSRLVAPPMADRAWGMDVLDEALVFELGDKLWENFSEQLLKEVDLIRRSNQKKKESGKE